MTPQPRAEVEARIDLFPTDEGGIRAEIQSGNRSMLFMFGEAYTTGSGSATGWFGAEIETLDGQPLRAGSRDLPVRIKMWAVHEGFAMVEAGSPFSIWLGRIGGKGQVTTAPEKRFY